MVAKNAELATKSNQIQSLEGQVNILTTLNQTLAGQNGALSTDMIEKNSKLATKTTEVETKERLLLVKDAQISELTAANEKLASEVEAKQGCISKWEKVHDGSLRMMEHYESEAVKKDMDLQVVCKDRLEVWRKFNEARLANKKLEREVDGKKRTLKRVLHDTLMQPTPESKKRKLHEGGYESSA